MDPVFFKVVVSVSHDTRPRLPPGLKISFPRWKRRYELIRDPHSLVDWRNPRLYPVYQWRDAIKVRRPWASRAVKHPGQYIGAGHWRDQAGSLVPSIFCGLTSKTAVTPHYHATIPLIWQIDLKPNLAGNAPANTTRPINYLRLDDRERLRCDGFDPDSASLDPLLPLDD